MVPGSGLVRHANFENRLQARRQAGSAVVGLPGLKSCSSEAHAAARNSDGLPSLYDRSQSGQGAAPPAHAAELGSVNKNTLPPIAPSNRGMVELRQAKRSCSNGAVCGAGAEIIRGQRRHTLPKARLHALASSQSAGSLGAHHQDEVKPDSAVEQCLLTALTLNGNPGAHKVSQDNCLSSDIEAHLQELMKFEDDNEESIPKDKRRSVRVSDHHGDNENHIHRKGTGFLYLDASADKTTDRRARIDDKHGDNENRLHRKGTGFVHLGSLPGKASVHRARIVDHHGDNENKLRRKGTGFLHLGASPELESGHRARILDDHGDNENNIIRKGTGFINLSALPTDSPSVLFPDITGGNVNRIQRKGTGYLYLKAPEIHARIVDSHGDNENRLHRKGTGFVDLSDCRGDSPSMSPRQNASHAVGEDGPFQT